MNELEFKLERVAFKEKYTIGKLYYRLSDNMAWQYFCDTLEDKVRPDGVKVYGETAIPDGVYYFIVAMSPHFKRKLPYILDVPNYKGIMMHNGTTAEDSLGCIIVGKNKEKGKVLESRLTVDRLMNLLKYNIQDKYKIEIINKN